MNKVMLTGRIVAPIVLQHVGGSNTPFTKVLLDVDDLVQNKNRKWETRVERYQVEIWRSRARYASEEFCVGDYVEVEACLRDTPDGIKLEAKEIVRCGAPKNDQPGTNSRSAG